MSPESRVLLNKPDNTQQSELAYMHIAIQQHPTKQL